MRTDSLQKKASTREIILSLIVILVLFYAINNYAFAPVNKKLALLHAEMERLVIQEQDLVTQITSLEQLKHKQTEKKQQASQLKLQLLEGQAKSEIEKIPDFVSTVSAPSFHQGMELSSLAIREGNVIAGYTEAHITLKASGSFPDILSFLEKLDSLPALSVNLGLFLERNEGKAGLMTLGLVTAFYEPKTI